VIEHPSEFIRLQRSIECLLSKLVKRHLRKTDIRGADAPLFSKHSIQFIKNLVSLIGGSASRALVMGKQFSILKQFEEFRLSSSATPQLPPNKPSPSTSDRVRFILSLLNIARDSGLKYPNSSLKETRWVVVCIQANETPAQRR
jgi:hypothetical protein